MFLVMIPNAWGRGESVIEAANVARKALRKKAAQTLPRPRVVFTFDPAATPTAYVNEYGMLCWEGTRPAQVEAVK